MSYLHIVQWLFAFTLCQFPAFQTVCGNFKIWIHNVMRLGKTNNVYEERTKSIALLTYWTAWNVLASTEAFLPDNPLAFKTKFCVLENTCLSTTREARWCNKPYSSLRLGHRTSEQIHSHFSMCIFICIHTYIVRICTKVTM